MSATTASACAQVHGILCSRFGLIKLPATVIQMDFSSHLSIKSIRDFSSPSAFKRLYYPPISDTRLRISGLRILAYAGRSDETCPTYTINSFYLFIFGRCMSPSWRHLNPDSFGDSRKRKPADLIPFVSPFPSLVIIFLFFSLSFFLPPLIPKILCTIVSAFFDKLWIVGHGLGVLLDGFFYVFSCLCTAFRLPQRTLFFL